MKAEPFYTILKYARRAEVRARFVGHTDQASPVGSYRSLRAAVDAVKDTGQTYRIYDVMAQKYIAA